MTIITDLLRMSKKQNVDINQLIISALTEEKQSTYSIAKKCGISWSTAISYLYKLKADFPELNIQTLEKFDKKKMTLWWKEAFINDIGEKA